MAKKTETSHGGAWKVAYADFVTAMMALFMVLWISAQDDKILIATSQYFQNPFRSVTQASNGVMPFNSQKSTRNAGDNAGAGKQDHSKPVELTFLNSVAADFYRLLHLDDNFEDKPIDIQVTTDGLRLTLYDRAQRPLFAEGSTEFTAWGKFVMQNIAWTIDRHHFRVTIDGHTRAGQKSATADYGDWELSADRANAARRSLVYYAVDPNLIERVTGYAATQPLPGEKPDAESNQRVTLSLTLSAKNRLKDSVMLEEPVSTVGKKAGPARGPAALLSP